MKITKQRLKKLIKEELENIRESDEFDISPDEFVERMAPLMPYLVELGGRDINLSWPASERNWAQGIADFAALVNELVSNQTTEEPQKGLAGSSYEDTLAAYKKNPEFFN